MTTCQTCQIQQISAYPNGERYPMNADTDILTAAEAADYLKLSVPHIRGLANEGKLPGMQFGDDWRFMRGQLYAYLVEQAENQQRARQGQHKLLTIAKEDGAITPKRGRPTKASAADIIAKYGKQYGGA